MESQSETTQTVSAIKLPVLKTGDCDIWNIRMEQYFTHTNYALWEVIVNGDAPAIASASAGTDGPIPPKTAEQKLARKNELKAKSPLLLAIPDVHLLKGVKQNLQNKYIRPTNKAIWFNPRNLSVEHVLPSKSIVLIMAVSSDIPGQVLKSTTSPAHSLFCGI
ncbi:hypothetical protein Tco_0545567 [Tanacetum coccineum]